MSVAKYCRGVAYVLEASLEKLAPMQWAILYLAINTMDSINSPSPHEPQLKNWIL